MMIDDYPTIHRGFNHPRWLFGIFSINSNLGVFGDDSPSTWDDPPSTKSSIFFGSIHSTTYIPGDAGFFFFQPSIRKNFRYLKLKAVSSPFHTPKLGHFLIGKPIVVGVFPTI